MVLKKRHFPPPTYRNKHPPQQNSRRVYEWSGHEQHRPQWAKIDSCVKPQQPTPLSRAAHQINRKAARGGYHISTAQRCFHYALTMSPIPLPPKTTTTASMLYSTTEPQYERQFRTTAVSWRVGGGGAESRKLLQAPSANKTSKKQEKLMCRDNVCVVNWQE